MSCGQAGNFAAPLCFCLHKGIFPGFPLGHVSGWHGFLFFGVFCFVFCLEIGVWLSCRTGNEGGSCADLEARSPLSLTVLFFFFFFLPCPEEFELQWGTSSL